MYFLSQTITICVVCVPEIQFLDSPEPKIRVLKIASAGFIGSKFAAAEYVGVQIGLPGIRFSAGPDRRNARLRRLNPKGPPPKIRNTDRFKSGRRYGRADGSLIRVFQIANAGFLDFRSAIVQCVDVEIGLPGIRVFAGRNQKMPGCGA
ncbi:MAG: hypothetical protein LBC63_03070 [Holophagales bacterium]|jgi:hypothetical protein|nr:hypothetical protein [Holophagales bacterium]